MILTQELWKRRAVQTPGLSWQKLQVFVENHAAMSSGKDASKQFAITVFVPNLDSGVERLFQSRVRSARQSSEQKVVGGGTLTQRFGKQMGELINFRRLSNLDGHALVEHLSVTGG